MKRNVALTVILLAAACAGASEKIVFAADDGLEVTADLYLKGPFSSPFIVLFHMAKSSRGEYLSIAGRLNALGFNVMAVDQRSGSSSGGVANETAARAKARGLGIGYLSALPDMRAALRIARERYAEDKLILWGSSYSASLVLKLAGDDPDCCDAALAFSPGEYFSPPDLIVASAKGIRVPVFVTSSKYEGDEWRPIFDAIPASGKISFLPTKTAGDHGSPALHPEKPGSAEYWEAVEMFLASVK